MENSILELLRALQWPSPNNPERPTYARIASKVGFSEWTVRARLRKMRVDGVIRDIKLVPRFPFLGLDLSAIGFRTKMSAEEIVSKASGFSWIYSVHIVVDGYVTYNILHRGNSDLARKIGVLEDLGNTQFPLADLTAFRKRKISFTLNELKILRELILHPFVSSKEIERTVGLEQGSAEKIINRLAARGAFSLRTALNSKKMENGIIFAAVLTTCTGCESKVVEHIISASDSDIYNIDDNYVSSVLVMGYSKNYARMLQCREWLSSIPFVTNVTTFSPVDTYPISEDEVIDAITSRLSLMEKKENVRSA